METEPGAAVRIGELSRRVGVSVHVLRAWESRYGLLQPTRSTAGYRLYTAADERRVRRMAALIADGLSAAEAARAVGQQSPPAPAQPRADPGGSATGGIGQAVAASFGRVLSAFDEPAAQMVLDRMLSELSLTTVLRDILLPYLHDLGERWQHGTASIAEEHFASNVIRGRLAGLARGWGAGPGPRAVLACPPGEVHDLPLMIFGIALNRVGWNVTYLGVDTPVTELTRTVEATGPDLVVLAATVSQRFDAVAAELAVVGPRAPLALAGAGANPALAQHVGARLLLGDPVTEAERAVTLL